MVLDSLSVLGASSVPVPGVGPCAEQLSKQLVCPRLSRARLCFDCRALTATLKLPESLRGDASAA